MEPSLGGGVSSSFWGWWVELEGGAPAEEFPFGSAQAGWAQAGRELVDGVWVWGWGCGLAWFKFADLIGDVLELAWFACGLVGWLVGGRVRLRLGCRLGFGLGGHIV